MEVPVTDTSQSSRQATTTVDELPETMQAVVCHGPEDYRLETLAVPTRGPGEVLVRVEAVGICASDLKCYHGAAKFWGDENRPAWAETEVIRPVSSATTGWCSSANSPSCRAARRRVASSAFRTTSCCIWGA